MSFTEEQIQTLTNLVSYMQEVLPRQLDTINDSIQTLQNRVSIMEQIVQQQQSLSTNDINDRSVKIRLPASFSGKSSLCNTYVTQLALYFAGNPSYNTDEKKILLAISCLAGPAYNYMEPFLAKINAPAAEKPDVLKNYDTFIETITNAFGDSDPTMNAESDLRRLKQTSSATAYVTEFRRLSSLVFWNEAALISQFKLNLKDSIQDELARGPKSRTLDELITATIEIDNRMYQRQRHRRLALPAPPVAPKPADTSSMDIDPPATKPRIQVSQEERNRRNQDRACYYCGVTGHFSTQCPAKKGRPHQVSTVLLGNPVESSPSSGWYNITSVLSKKDFTSTQSNATISTARDDFHDYQANLNFKNEPLLFVPVHIGVPMPGANHLSTKAMLDTGASTNLISLELAAKLGVPIAYSDSEEDCRDFVMANGSVSKSYGTYTTVLRLANSIFHSETITFHVMAQASQHIILGMPWIKKHNVVIHPAVSAAYLNCDPSKCCGDFDRTAFAAAQKTSPLAPPAYRDDLTFARNRKMGYPKTHYPTSPPSPTTSDDYIMNKDNISSAYSSCLTITCEKLNN